MKLKPTQFLIRLLEEEIDLIDLSSDEDQPPENDDKIPSDADNDEPTSGTDYEANHSSSDSSVFNRDTVLVHPPTCEDSSHIPQGERVGLKGEGIGRVEAGHPDCS